jgi:hypothetical protein
MDPNIITSYVGVVDAPIVRTEDQVRGLYNLITMRGVPDTADPEGIWDAEGRECAYLMAQARVLAWAMGRNRPPPNLDDDRVWDTLDWLVGAGICPIGDDGHSLRYQPSVPPARHARNMQERAAKRAEPETWE